MIVSGRPVQALIVALLTFTAALLPARAVAQESALRLEAMRLDVSRQRLKAVQAELQQRVSSGKQAQDRKLLDAIRRRLENGDFRPGDRIVLSVEGEAELTDTFTVQSGPSLDLPTIGTVDLQGILASELTESLARDIAHTLRDPLVNAQALIQLSVLGDVARPGFYLVPPEAPLSDVLMEAGGPTQTAKVDEIRIERGPRSRLVQAPSKSRPYSSIEALSADELGLRTGDRIIVPGSSGLTTHDVVQFTILGLTTVVSLYSLLVLHR